MATATVIERPSEGAWDRRHFLGGSDMAAVLGLSPWKTPYQLWVEKTADAVEEVNPKREAFFKRGKRLEPYVINWVREDFGLDIVATNQRFTDPELPFLSCEIDFEHMDDGIQNADVKTAHYSKAKEWGEEGTDEIPDQYTVQFLFGQMVTGRSGTLCCTLIGADDLRIYRVPRDEAIIRHIREKAIEFWEMVETRRAPAITTLEDAKLAWAKDNGRAIQATPEIEEMVERLDLIKRGIAGDQAKADLLQLDVQKYMADHTELVDSHGKKLASWKKQARKAYTVEATEFRCFRA